MATQNGTIEERTAETDANAPFSFDVPENLHEWAKRNRSLIAGVSRALQDAATKPIHEDSLWSIVASAHSPEWALAKNELCATETSLKEIHSPDNRPLGLIGGALDSEATVQAENRHVAALAAFTISNEDLRQNEDLQTMMAVLMMNYIVIDRALENSRMVRDIAGDFASVAEPPKQSALLRAFTALSRKIASRSGTKPGHTPKHTL